MLLTKTGCESQREPQEEHVARGGAFRFDLDSISRDALKSARVKLNAERSVRHPHSYFVRRALRMYGEYVSKLTTEAEIYAERLLIAEARRGK